MKNKYVVVTLLFLMALGFSCTDESKYPLPFNTINNSNAGILKQIAQTSITFDKFNIPGAKYEVILEANDANRGGLFTKVEVFVSFVDRTPTSSNGNGSAAEKLAKTYQASEFVKDPTTGLPRLTVSITAPETLALLGLNAADMEGSDQFIYRQAMHFPDGNVYSSNNVNTAISSLGGVYKSPFANVVAVVCPSDLGGTVNYSTIVTGAVVPIAPCLPGPVTGTTEFKEVGPGKYDIGDSTFGQYDCAWNDNPATGTRLEDACNILQITGADQYGLVYGWVIVSNTGTNLVINWFNDYGDTGTTTLTRTGKTWPLTLSMAP